jgi:hypothetical protein
MNLVRRFKPKKSFIITVKRDNLLETCVYFWFGAVAQRELTRKGEVPLN